ncbi:CheR family methyltransferase [Sulfitobacter aestuariivivens]|uniref:Chemotaxis protein methyltransferase n=1 Tax=Sulfitobacter aestuariivivens TaxID=2766981 RepID=A0A927D2J2_9RHOB|nr:CheR family methyltransferase [Sulfitobacter aestuariivivens]MBD3663216.1 protein-glutamate O-methyltransferase CheR [Sulfitobacter aestuariivivens]
MMRQTDPTQTLDGESFRTIAALAYRESGLTLVEEKAIMIQSRLRHRLRALGIGDFAQYTAFLTSEEGQPERRELICALTTNVSHFYREKHHFEMMCEVVQSRLSALQAGDRVRIWSAGCSNGQESLSAALFLLERFPCIGEFDLRILGTDIDRQVIRFARAGTYSEKMIEGLPQDVRQRHFTPRRSAKGDLAFQARPDVMRLIRYNELNILGDWPMRNAFDIIFCRNVVIYFDLMTQARLWPRFRDALRPGGLLFLGHSERITDPARVGFDIAGATAYRPLMS